MGSMGSKAVSKEARRAARLAAAAAQEEVIRRTKANVEDLAAFFDARERAEAVDEWLAERQRALAEQAAARRAGHRRQCGVALQAMRDRGESLREIARMAGVSEKTVREMIRDVESREPADQVGASAPSADGGAAAPPVAGVGWDTANSGGAQVDARCPRPAGARV